jgi:acetyl-CoA carboxylase biotin carboxyl carrier protein
MATRPKTERAHVDLNEIKKLFEMVERSSIAEFELIDKDLKIRISKNGAHFAPIQVMNAPAAMPAMAAPPAAPSAIAASAAPILTTPAPQLKLYEIKSPMVGTFYRAPAPDADPYVKAGDVVDPGKVICIVEAMKLMNEIESDVRGRVVEILIENAQPVEYGQVLIRIDTSAA